VSCRVSIVSEGDTHLESIIRSTAEVSSRYNTVYIHVRINDNRNSSGHDTFHHMADGWVHVYERPSRSQKLLGQVGSRGKLEHKRQQRTPDNTDATVDGWAQVYERPS